MHSLYISGSRLAKSPTSINMHRSKPIALAKTPVNKLPPGPISMIVQPSGLPELAMNCSLTRSKICCAYSGISIPPRLPVRVLRIFSYGIGTTPSAILIATFAHQGATVNLLIYILLTTPETSTHSTNDTASYAYHSDAQPTFCESVPGGSNLPAAIAAHPAVPQPSCAAGHVASCPAECQIPSWAARSVLSAHAYRVPDVAAICPGHP